MASPPSPNRSAPSPISTALCLGEQLPDPSARSGFCPATDDFGRSDSSNHQNHQAEVPIIATTPDHHIVSGSESPKQGRSREKTAIRNCIDGWATALRAKRVGELLSDYTPDPLFFDLAPPLQHDRKGTRKGLNEWVSTFRGPIGYEIRDLQITCRGDVAFSHSLNRLSGTRTSGETTDVWVRATMCFRKLGGKWLIAYEQVSVPFYMDGSGRASLDLKP